MGSGIGRTKEDGGKYKHETRDILCSDDDNADKCGA